MRSIRPSASALFVTSPRSVTPSGPAITARLVGTSKPESGLETSFATIRSAFLPSSFVRARAARASASGSVSARTRSQMPIRARAGEGPNEVRNPTRIFRRGDWLKPGKEVSYGVPAVLHPLPEGADEDGIERVGSDYTAIARERGLDFATGSEIGDDTDPTNRGLLSKWCIALCSTG